MERSYIAFISYKHAQRDAVVAKQVHTLIENYVIPKSLRKDSRKLGIVFRDEEELPISSDLTESICKALDASRYLIVICSPESKKSPWVEREVKYFLKHHKTSAAFAVMVDGEPNDVFPFELTHVWNSETGGYDEIEPLALDVRADTIEGTIKKTKAQIKKLFAGMLGCSYDSLVQREKIRRTRRIAAIVALCTVLASCFSGMLFIKNRQLAQKNDQLTEAIELTLLREAELLTGEAEEALDNGDMAAAIKYASDALSDEEIQRPYHPQAERVLFYAMDVLREGVFKPMISKVGLEHTAPIEGAVYSADGRAVYTIDRYGVVQGFDAAAGDLLWEVKLREYRSSYGVAPQIFYCNENGTLCCYYNGIFTGLNALTGETVWETTSENEMVAGVCFEDAKKKLAYIERSRKSASQEAVEGVEEYSFVVISAVDGRLLNRIPIAELAYGMSVSDSVDFAESTDGSAFGVFPDADCFAGTLFKVKNEVRSTLLYKADLAKNSVSFIENNAVEKTTEYVGTVCIGKQRAVVLSQKGAKGVNLQCYDLKTGDLLWENIAAPDEYVSGVCRAAVSKTETLIAVGDLLLEVVNDTGEVVSYKKYGSEIADLYLLEEQLFGVTLKNGSCIAGWWNEHGLGDSRLLGNMIVNLPETPVAFHHNGGFFRARYADDMLDSFYLASGKDGGGSVMYLSEDRCTAYVAMVLENPQLPQAVQVAAEGKTGSYLDMNRRGTVLMGEFDTENGHTLSLLDPAQHACTKIASADGLPALKMDLLYLTDDEQTLIACCENGDLYRIGLDGSVQMLAAGEKVQITDVFTGEKYASDAVRLTADGQILAAFCDGESVKLWTNGESEKNVQIPEEVCWASVDGNKLRHAFRIGANGQMLLSDFAAGDSAEMENFALLDAVEEKWVLIPDPARGNDDRPITVGEKKPVFAVYDEDMVIRVYDRDAAEPVQCIYAELPMVSVLKIGMLQEDRYLYVLTKDGRIVIYDIAANEMVFRTTFDGVYAAEDFSVWPDADNNRLYMGTRSDMLCADLRSWEQLFRGSKVEFFSAAGNEVYRMIYDAQTETSSLTAIPIPTTPEIVKIAQNVFP